MRRVTFYLLAAALTFTLGTVVAYVFHVAFPSDDIRALVSGVRPLTMEVEWGMSRKPNLEDEEYAVYSAMIDEMYLREGVGLAVIEDRAGDCKHSADSDISPTREIDFHMNGLQQETSSDYARKNRQCMVFARRFSLRVPYTLVTEADLNRLSSGRHPLAFWDRFYQRYPQSAGVISFSRVGFNRDVSQAFVSVSHGCGVLCGDGHIVLLRKVQGVWKIDDKEMIWVS